MLQLIYFAFQENSDSIITQNEIKNYFVSSKIDFNSIININPQEDISTLNQYINNNLYINENKFNFFHIFIERIIKIIIKMKYINMALGLKL